MSRSRQQRVTCDAAGATNAQAIYVSGTVASIVGNSSRGAARVCTSAIPAPGWPSSSAQPDHRAGHGERCGDPHPIGQRAGVVGNQMTGGAHFGAIWLDTYYLRSSRGPEWTRTHPDVPTRDLCGVCDTLIGPAPDTRITPSVYRGRNQRVGIRHIDRAVGHVLDCVRVHSGPRELLR